MVVSVINIIIIICVIFPLQFLLYCWYKCSMVIDNYDVFAPRYSGIIVLHVCMYNTTLPHTSYSWDVSTSVTSATESISGIVISVGAYHDTSVELKVYSSISNI